MALPAPSPGRPLEAEGDLRSRGMTVLDRIRAYRPARRSSSERWGGPYRRMNPTRRIEYARIRWHRGRGDFDRSLRRTGSRRDPEPDGPANCESDAEPVADGAKRVQGGPEGVECEPADHWTRA